MKNKATSKIVESEIIIYQVDDGHTKLMLNLKMRLFGLHRHNYVNSTTPVNPILVSILNAFLKKANWKKIQLFGNSEQLLLTGKKYNTIHYNLDMISSLGDRVKSKIATNFRR